MLYAFTLNLLAFNRLTLGTVTLAAAVLALAFGLPGLPPLAVLVTWPAKFAALDLRAERGREGTLNPL